MIRLLEGFFDPPELPVAPSEAVLWWENRRIPFNIFIGGYGACCLGIFLVSISTSGHLQPGQDAVEPLGLMAAPFAVNILYTLGWLVEAPFRVFSPNSRAWLGPVLLKLGLAFGAFLISLPAAFWGILRIGQVLGLVK